MGMNVSLAIDYVTMLKAISEISRGLFIDFLLLDFNLFRERYNAFRKGVPLEPDQWKSNPFAYLGSEPRSRVALLVPKPSDRSDRTGQ